VSLSALPCPLDGGSGVVRNHRLFVGGDDTHLDAVAGPAQPEPDEEIAVVLLTRAEVRELLHAGAIRNGLLLIAVLWWLGPFAGPAGRR